jgi:glycosyltransferase involved in cell wall biosynthesis
MNTPPRIWVVEVGEPLPLSNARPRLMRAGQIAERLMRAGADVTWWVSDFNHAAKRPYDLAGMVDQDRAMRLKNGVLARFLHGRPYSRNVSVARMLHNREVARDFSARADSLSLPQAILCCYPTIDLADATTAFGKARSVPVVLDVRDLWPDVFIDVSPLPKAVTRALIAPLTIKARSAFRNATAISAISEPILDWALEKACRPRGERDRVLPLSYELPELTDAERAECEAGWREKGLKLDGSEKIAVIFGNLSNVPEFETVVEALRMVPPQLADRLKIVICGAGERLEWLSDQASRQPQLLLPGFVSGSAIAALMPHAFSGILIYPSRPDFARSIPNKVGEYLSGGLPVVSTLTGASGDLLRLRGCGFVVPNRDAKAFADALTMLASDEAMLARMKCAALETFCEVFDARKNYRSMADFLWSLAGTNEKIET